MREVPQWIRTYTGKRFYPLAPNREHVDILDIAQALSNQCRFAGHTSSHYSVAQHSVYVSHLTQIMGADKEVQVAALLHDASEAYLVDLPTPVKRQVTGYVEAEAKVSHEIYAKYAVEFVDQKQVHDADLAMLAVEARDLMGNPKDWGMDVDISWVHFGIQSLTPVQAKELFLSRAAHLGLDVPYHVVAFSDWRNKLNL